MSNHFAKGTKALEKGDLSRAISLLKKADPVKETLLNLGNAYLRSGQKEKALKTYKECLTAPFSDGTFGEYAEAYTNLGIYYYAVGDDISAIACYSKAAEIDPTHANTIWNHSHCLLRQWCSGGPLNPEAWDMYSYRFKTVNKLKAGSLLPWDRISKVSRLVVLPEQGFGDKIMWGRYFSLLTSFTDDLIIILPKEMHKLFSGYNCTTEMPSSGYFIPLASLASVFGNRKDLGAYLKYEKTELDGFNIYCEWEGSKTHANDMFRSCSPHHFLEMPGTKWNARPGATVPRGINHINVDDWSLSASLVASMDLVITVDTSIAHLAGALNVDCWMIQPLQHTDFRWGEPTSKEIYGMSPEENIWYDSVVVIENKSWDVTFTKLLKRLKNVQDNRQPMGADGSISS